MVAWAWTHVHLRVGSVHVTTAKVVPQQLRVQLTSHFTHPVIHLLSQDYSCSCIHSQSVPYVTMITVSGVATGGLRGALAPPFLLFQTDPSHCY